MADQPRFDEDKIDEVALAMMYFSRHGSSGLAMRAWKGFAWRILGRLYDKGWISDPKTKSKSVVFTEEGEELAEEYAVRHFGLPE